MPGNVEGGYYGMRLLGSKGGEVKNTTIFNARQHGILIYDVSPKSQSLTISGNNIHHNSAAGILVAEALSNNNSTLISDNTIAHNTFGIRLEDTQGATLSKNIISQNTTGVALMGATSGNSVSENTITDSAAEGLFLDKHATKNSVTQNVVQQNTVIDVADFQLLLGDPADGPNTWKLNICDTSMPKGLCVHEYGIPTPPVIDTTPPPLRPTPTPIIIDTTPPPLRPTPTPAP